MYAVAVVGSDSTELVERLVRECAAEGAVATLSPLPLEPAPGFEDAIEFKADGASVALGLGPEGWTAHGRERALDDALDDLAPEHDYAFCDGFDGARLPTVVAGEYDGDVAGEVVARVPAGDADLAPVLDAVRATEPYVTLESLVERAKRSPDADYAGAIATFTGRVRAKEDAEDARTELLEFEKYEGVAEAEMDRIGAELTERDGVFEVLMHHRTGVIPDGEDIVFVVVLAGHREEAFRTVEDGINRLKDEVPIFKKEVTTDEEFWVHERD